MGFSTTITISSSEEATLSAIRINDVRKVFHRRGGEVVVALDGISLTVAQHEMVAIVGPSGCGKTTLLRCLAGLERPSTGEIYVGDELVFNETADVFLPPEKPASG